MKDCVSPGGPEVLSWDEVPYRSPGRARCWSGQRLRVNWPTCWNAPGATGRSGPPYVTGHDLTGWWRRWGRVWRTGSRHPRVRGDPRAAPRPVRRRPRRPALPGPRGTQRRPGRGRPGPSPRTRRSSPWGLARGGRAGPRRREPTGQPACSQPRLRVAGSSPPAGSDAKVERVRSGAEWWSTTPPPTSGGGPRSPEAGRAAGAGVGERRRPGAQPDCLVPGRLRVWGQQRPQQWPVPPALFELGVSVSGFSVAGAHPELVRPLRRAGPAAFADRKAVPVVGQVFPAAAATAPVPADRRSINHTVVTMTPSPKRESNGRGMSSRCPHPRGAPEGRSEPGPRPTRRARHQAAVGAVDRRGRRHPRLPTNSARSRPTSPAPPGWPRACPNTFRAPPSTASAAPPSRPSTSRPRP